MAEDTIENSSSTTETVSPVVEKTGPQNALQDNIAKKGQNAYYYAHSKSEVNDSVFNFGGEPMKLDVTPDDALFKSGKQEKKIGKYSWAASFSYESSLPIANFVENSSLTVLDGKKFVKIYIEQQGVDELSPENIKLDWETKSLKLTLMDEEIDHMLHLPKLHDEIDNATFQKKEGNRLVLSLRKSQQCTWYQLVSK